MLNVSRVVGKMSGAVFYRIVSGFRLSSIRPGAG